MKLLKKLFKKEDSTESQCKKILKHLQSGKSISPMEALNLFGCWRLSARIHDLRDAYNIKMVLTEKGDKKYATYTLIK